MDSSFIFENSFPISAGFYKCAQIFLLNLTAVCRKIYYLCKLVFCRFSYSCGIICAPFYQFSLFLRHVSPSNEASLASLVDDPRVSEQDILMALRHLHTTKVEDLCSQHRTWTAWAQASGVGTGLRPLYQCFPNQCLPLPPLVVAKSLFTRFQ